MLKHLAKHFLGDRLAGVFRSGLDTLRYYPQYVFGHGTAKQPRHITIEITFACNARCRMCPLYGEHIDDHRVSRDGELTTAEIKLLLRECGSLGMKGATFTGGEPFLRKDLCELIAFGKEQGLQTSVITNGSLLTEGICNAVVAAGLDTLTISLDGPGEIHDAIRRVPNMFTRMNRNMNLLKAAQVAAGSRRPSVTVGCTVSSLNQSVLPEIVRVTAAWGFPLVFAPAYYSTREQEDATRLIFDESDVKPENWLLSKEIRNVDPRVVCRNLQDARLAARKLHAHVTTQMGGEGEIGKWFRDPYYAHNNKCLYPWYALRVSPFGDVYPCSLQGKMGNVRDQSLRTIWNGEKYVRFRQKLRQVGLFPKCAKCCALDRLNLVSRVLPRIRFVR